jgi:UDP-N-acetylglucosamine 3-dehydrogenase
MKIGLWGCGTMGTSLAKGLSASDMGTLVAVYDKLPDAAAKLAEEHGAKSVGSAEELLATKGLDGVMIALPTDIHAPATIQSADAGINVFVEKPMSLTRALCMSMIEAAKRNRIKLTVGQVLRYYEPYRSMIRWAKEKRFGEIRAAAIWRVQKSVVPGVDGWRLDRKRSGGMLFEVGIHELDTLRLLFGRPRTVNTLGRDPLCRTADAPGEDFLSVQIRFAEGGVATYETGLASFAGRYGFRVFYDQATIISDSAFDPKALQILGPDGPLPIDFESERSQVNPITAELEAWITAIRDDTPAPVPGEEGMATIAITETAYRSAQTKKVEEYLG